MTKLSKWCKVQLQLRVQTACAGGSGSCVDRTGREWRKGVAGGKGRCPRKLQLQELLPFHAGRPPLGALPLLPPGALEAPDACSVRYDANLRQHDMACALLTLKTRTVRWTRIACVPCMFTIFGQGNRSHRDRPTGNLVGVAHNGPGFLGGRRSQDRQVPDGPETRTLNTVAPVRRGATCGMATGAGALAAQPGLDHET